MTESGCMRRRLQCFGGAGERGGGARSLRDEPQFTASLSPQLLHTHNTMASSVVMEAKLLVKVRSVRAWEKGGGLRGKTNAGRSLTPLSKTRAPTLTLYSCLPPSIFPPSTLAQAAPALPYFKACKAWR